MAGKSQNHYEILEVSRSADHGEIRRAYLSAARRWHPDRHAGKSAEEAAKAEQAMRRANQAWDVLGDKASREAYDRQLSPGERSASSGFRTDEGVTRIDPRLLDPQYLAARRDAQLTDISARSSIILRAVPLLAVLGLLVAIFVFTAYARTPSDIGPDNTVPGPSLGTGIQANDCVVVTSGPALMEVPCQSNAERVFGARLPDGTCPLGTDRDVILSNGSIVCLDTLG